jgi:DNA-binding NtrC family response regulator
MKISLVDRQIEWRQRLIAVLAGAGYPVDAYDRYECLAATLSAAAVTPDVVILGCVRYGSEEGELLQALVGRGLPVLVLASFLPWIQVPLLFRAGASDAFERPYSATRLRAAVEDGLRSLVPPCAGTNRAGSRAR